MKTRRFFLLILLTLAALFFGPTAMLNELQKGKDLFLKTASADTLRDAPGPHAPSRPRLP